MSKKPDPNVKPRQDGIVATDSLNAPIIYFDGAPTFSGFGGIVSITLCAGRHLPNGSGVATDIVAVAHLKCSITAAMDLRESINAALLAAAPTSEKAN